MISQVFLSEITLDFGEKAMDDIQGKLNEWYEKNAKRQVTIHLSLIDLLMAYGNMCLGLKHPENHGPSRKRALKVLAAMEAVFLKSGMPPAILDELHNVESGHSSAARVRPPNHR